MRWIHLSDIHYNPGTQMNRSTNQLRKKLPQYIRDNGIVADEMFITGDFRNATAPCDDEESLVDDTVNFIMEIANSAKIADNSHIHIVPGNHDLTRVDTSPSITKIRNCYDVSEGGFKIDILRQLISRFGFFVKIKNQLNPGDPLWSPELLPLADSGMGESVRSQLANDKEYQKAKNLAGMMNEVKNRMNSIAFNEYFDTQVDEVVIASSTLNGKFINQKVSDINELNTLIEDDIYQIYCVLDKRKLRTGD